MCVWLACRRLGTFCHLTGTFLIPMECEYSVGKPLPEKAGGPRAGLRIPQKLPKLHQPFRRGTGTCGADAYDLDLAAGFRN